MGLVNALTVDVEDYFHVQAFADVIERSAWGKYRLRVEYNTRRLLEIFDNKRVRASFFILGWVAERCPSLVKEIREAGHRIGCHSYGHGLIYEGSKDDFRDDLRRARNIIEDTTGVQVKSFRAPSFSITARSLWALDILGEEGFEYDSSIFPILHANYGISSAPRFPYLRELSSGLKIKEFPPSTVQIFGRNLPVAGGGYLRLLPIGLTAWAIRYLNDTERQPAMVYLHPWELDADQPRIGASWVSRFRQYQNLRSTESKCLRLLDEFSWAPMEDVLASRWNS